MRRPAPGAAWAVIGQVRDWSARRRRILAPAALALFLAALVVALSSLDLDWRGVRLWPLFLNALVLTPSALLLNGAGVSLVAWSLGRRLSVRSGVVTAAVGAIAELSPAPGSLAARAGALAASGAPAEGIARALGACAALFSGFAVVAAAVPLRGEAGGAALICLLIGAGLAGAGAGVLLLRVGAAATAALIAHRLASLGLLLVRVWCAFAALDAVISWGEAPLFSAAAVLGALVFVLPGGLGAAELAAAALAPLAAAAPAAAFTALALNRVLTLGCSGLIALVALGRFARPPGGASGPT